MGGKYRPFNDLNVRNIFLRDLFYQALGGVYVN